MGSTPVGAEVWPLLSSSSSVLYHAFENQYGFCPVYLFPLGNIYLRMQDKHISVLGNI